MRLQGAYYKPKKPRFIGKGKYHIGVELEMEADTMLECPDCGYEDCTDPACVASGPIQAGLALKDRPLFCYAKTDGSLRGGWELVTQPIAVEKWMEPTPRPTSSVGQLFSLIDELRELGYSSHNNGRCGFHIHVDRKALDIVKSSRRDSRRKPSRQYYWFRRLINSPLFTELSQRERGQLNQWAEQNYNLFLDPRIPIEIGAGRYNACITTENTIEVRIFRGNMREDRLRKAIESVVAAIALSKSLASQPVASIYKQNKSDAVLFTDHVLSHKEKYTNLYDFLKEKDLFKWAHTGQREKRLRRMRKRRQESIEPPMEFTPWSTHRFTPDLETV